jgi:hypothetical protein
VSIVSKKHKIGINNRFYQDVAQKRPEHVFGLKPCGVSWDSLIKDSLIINYIDLSCCCDEATNKSNCLVGKLSHNCNCK